MWYSKSLKRKILLLTLIPVSVAMIAIGGLAIINKSTTERSLLLSRLASFRSLLESGDLTFASTADKRKLEIIFDERVNHSELLQTSDTAFFSTTTKNDLPVLPKYSEAEQRFISQAFKGTETSNIVSENGKSALAYISPIIVDGNVVAVLHQSLSFERSNQRIIGYAAVIMTEICLGILVCFSLISWLLQHAVLKYIYQLKEAALRISRGDLNTQLTIATQDEIGDLSQTFDQMRSKINTYQAELTSSIRSLPFGFALINTDKEIVFANALLPQLLQGSVSPKAAIEPSLTFKELSASLADSITLEEKLLECQKLRKRLVHEVSYGPAFFRIFFNPIMDESNATSEVLGTVLIIEDVSEEKALQRSRDEFFSIASHELRTPLTAIRGNASMMLNYYGEVVKNPELKAMVDDTHDASIRLIAIVNDFLESSRLEQGRMEFKLASITLPPLIEETMKPYEMTEQSSAVKLAFDDGGREWPAVMADGDRVRQIVINLIGNGLKFTEKGSVTVMFEQPDPQHLLVLVKDTGSGIPLESQHLLFHKFQQASNNILTRDNTRSTGLGLYISRMMAEGMNGKLYLKESKLGQGSTFALELPLASTRKTKTHSTSAA